MSNTTIYECPECGERKMADHHQDRSPTLWCDCDGFVVMEKEYRSIKNNQPEVDYE